MYVYEYVSVKLMTPVSGETSANAYSTCDTRAGLTSLGSEKRMNIYASEERERDSPASPKLSSGPTTLISRRSEMDRKEDLNTTYQLGKYAMLTLACVDIFVL